MLREGKRPCVVASVARCAASPGGGARGWRCSDEWAHAEQVDAEACAGAQPCGQTPSRGWRTGTAVPLRSPLSRWSDVPGGCPSPPCCAVGHRDRWLASASGCTRALTRRGRSDRTSLDSFPLPSSPRMRAKAFCFRSSACQKCLLACFSQSGPLSHSLTKRLDRFQEALLAPRSRSDPVVQRRGFRPHRAGRRTARAAWQ